MAQEYDNFFDDLFANEEVTETKKAEPKKSKAPAKKAEKKPATPKASLYKTPLKVVTGYMPEFTLGADAFSGKEKDISETDVKTAVQALYPYYTGKGVRVKRVSETEVQIYLSHDIVQNKGNVKLTSKSSAYLGATQIPLTNFLKEEDGTDVDVETLKKELIKAIDVEIHVSGDTLCVIPGTRTLAPAEEVKLPLVVSVLTGRRTEVTLTDADFEKKEAPAAEDDTEDEEDAEDTSDDEDEESEESEGSEATNTKPAVQTENGKITASMVQAELEKRFPTFKGGLKLCACVEDGKTVGYTVRFEPEAVRVGGAPKETTYPSEGLTISLLFKRYKVTAADFGGKTEVTAKDIAAYLRSQGEFDYEDDKTHVSNYNKETATVVVSFRGGTKG